MTVFERAMLAKMDELLREIRVLSELAKRPALKVVQGGKADPTFRWPADDTGAPPPKGY